MTKSGISKISIGLPVIPSSQNDEVTRVANRIVSNLELVNVPIESVVRFIGMATEAEGIPLEWHAKEKKFKRAYKA
jgi:hypothetical protein